MSRLLCLLAASSLLVACRSDETATVQLSSGIDRSGFDESVRPQDDFNAYVNGTWLEATPIPADRQSWGAGPILTEESEQNQRAIAEELSEREDLTPGTDEQRVGDFFASYTDVETIESLGIEPIREELEKIRGAGSFDELLWLNLELARTGIAAPLEVAVFPDLGDSTRYAVYLSQSGLTLPDRDYYSRAGDKFETIRKSLPLYAAELFELAGIADGEARGRAAYEVERRLAEAHWPAEEVRDVQKMYNPYPVSDLAQVSADLDWSGLLNAMELSSVESLIVAQPSYVTALGKLAREFPLDDFRSYVMLRLLHGAAPFLTDAFVGANFEFSGKLVGGLEELPPRWKRGVRILNETIGEAVGRVYVERHFPPEAKARMEALVRNLVAAFGEAIDDLDWMTEKTKQRAQDKRSKFTYKVGYPDRWRDYAGLDISRGELLGNVRRANHFDYRRNIDKLGAPIDRTEWQMTPQTVNAYHDPTLNEIVFPAGILQPPFFDLAADDAVNYGAIGAVIGHEIGHAFDDQGRRFDGDGNLVDWWSEADAVAYEERASVLAEQYDAFEALEDLHVNGRLTLGENIGDLTGVAIAYRAYRMSLSGDEPPVLDGFTGAERFFIGYAQVWRTKLREEYLRERLVSDPHSPPEFRTNGPLRNLPAFYEAFGVEEGDGMWLPPEERVSIW